MEPVDHFHRHQPRLLALAYRLLGSRADAEDVVQDTWLRWHRADRAAIADPEAWLVTTATRLGIDRLRAARRRRETYPGPWLPEPARVDPDAPTAAASEPADEAPGPARALERAEEVSLAFLAVLERLGPEERAAFLLREVFDHDYAAIARLLERSEAACRQMVHRARTRIAGARPRFGVDPRHHRILLEKFMHAAREGDREAVQALLHADAQLVSDGGGKALAAIRPLHGAERIARLFWAVARRRDPAVRWQLGLANGEPAILRYRDGRLVGVTVAASADGRITALYTVANPDKLAVTDASPGTSWW
ncbi:RNA polymerase sigma-70 factor [Pseudoxanthomonas sp. SGNA-20]|uniref:RNA polymerase sigma-70 factor n=1 Tax=unclassified Pseudoxanthomonas TaxID=2645906 RepID=UPI0002F3160F|nr:MULTISPECIES: RNA polymerase sigma-70 factor [unclassified Pseudoxanthomonas]RRN57258.1 RNA polymerase sigma-70 factor [Pseudoxanthomonas sp. SGNA-20]